MSPAATAGECVTVTPRTIGQSPYPDVPPPDCRRANRCETQNAAVDCPNLRRGENRRFALSSPGKPHGERPVGWRRFQVVRLPRRNGSSCLSTVRILTQL